MRLMLRFVFLNHWETTNVEDDDALLADTGMPLVISHESGGVRGSSSSVASDIAAGASTTTAVLVSVVVGSIVVVSSDVSRKNFNKRFRRNAVDIHAK